MKTKHTYKWNPKKGKALYPIDWANIDLADGYEASRDLIDPLTFEGLLLQIRCNCRTIDAASIEHEFLTALQSRIDEAKELFELNSDNILSKALAERSEP